MACGCNNSYYNLPCCCPPAVVGTTTTTTTTLCPDAIICEEAYQSDCIIYNGPDLTCYGITSGSTVTEILNIIIAQLDPCTTTTTSTTTVCVRPTGLTTYILNTAINGVNFNANLVDACNAYNQYIANPGGNTLSGISGQGSSLSYGSVIYNGEDGDCTLVPNGYYIINGQPGVVTMINGVVNAYDLCPTTTSTTSTSTTTTTTSNPFAPFLCECINYSVENLSGFDAVIPFTDCLTGLPDPDGVTVLAGDIAEFCACIDSIPTITGITVTPIGPCAIPTTTTTTTEEPTTTTTTTAEPTTTTTTTTIEPTTSTTTTSSTTTTTTADPSITTTTSTTTTVNPTATRLNIVNEDTTYNLNIVGIVDLGTGLSIPLDSGSFPLTPTQTGYITLPNGLYDLRVQTTYNINGVVTLIDSNGTATYEPVSTLGYVTFTSIFLDDAGGTSPASITLSGPTFIVKATNDITNTINSVSPTFYNVTTGSFPTSTGQNLYGTVSSGGTSITVNYTSTAGPNTQILIIKNNITVGNDGGIPNGTNLNYTYNVSWLSTDIIEVRLNNYL